MFNKLLYKLNLITATEYNQSLIEALEYDEDEMSGPEIFLFLIFLMILYIFGCLWIGIM